MKNNFKTIINKKILIVGCGGVGSNLIKLLSDYNFKNLEIVDLDIVDKTNLIRQFFFKEQIKNFKVESIEKNVKLFNKNFKIKKHKFFLNKENYKKICKDKDLIIDTTDNTETRFLIEEISQKLKIDWIYSGAIRDESCCCIFYNKDKSKNFNKIFKKRIGNQKCSDSNVLNSTIHITCSLIFNKMINYFTKNKKDKIFIKYISLSEKLFKIKF